MKKLVYLLVLCLTTSVIFAQSKYEAGMKKTLEQFKAATKVDEYLTVSAAFERIAEAEKDKWLPYYYAAFCYNLSAMLDEKADKDKMSEKSTALLEKAEALDSNNCELFCLRNMIATTQMMVDPMTRWMKYGALASAALASAKKADPSNPRPYYLEGQSVFNTPEMYGGGKKKAKPLFEKAVELYAAFKPASDFHPNWGKDEAGQMLKQCE